MMMSKNKQNCKIPSSVIARGRPLTSPATNEITPKNRETFHAIQNIVREEVTKKLSKSRQIGSDTTLTEEPSFDEESAHRFLRSIVDVDRLLSMEKRLENLERKYQILLTTIHFHLKFQHQRKESAESTDSKEGDERDRDAQEENEEIIFKPWIISTMNPKVQLQFPCLQFCPPNQNYLMRNFGKRKVEHLVV